MPSSIPKVIYMCDNTIDFIQKYSFNWKKLNPEYDIQLFDNARCRRFLSKNFNPIVLKIFDYIPRGPIKADLWRICVLLKHGGVYVDADIEPIVPLKDFVNPNADFVTCRSYSKDPTRKYNPNFIVSKRNMPILRKALFWYIKKFNKNKKNFSYWKWSIMTCLTYVLKKPQLKKPSIIELYNIKMQLLTEVKGVDHYDDHNLFNGIRVFNNRYKDWDFITHSFNKK